MRLCVRVRVCLCVFVCVRVRSCVRVCVYLCLRIENSVFACSWSIDSVHPARSALACPSVAGMRRCCRWLEGLCTVL
jgi:hypothetical protein